jgi:toluene monooxygenase electron transfer component
MDSIPATRRTAIFLRHETLTHDMGSFVFQTRDPAAFVPGQFAMLDLPDVEGDRAYSMANLPNDEGLWEFIIKEQPGGDGSVALFDAFPPGTELALDGPHGEAVLNREAIDRPIVCIGGGAGISQLISILRGAQADPTLNRNPMTLFYGGRRPDDICAPRLLQRAGLADTVACVTAVSEPAADDDWQGPTGLIPDVLHKHLAAWADPANCEYYFCGPTPMTDAVRQVLCRGFAVPESQQHFDSFG